MKQTIYADVLICVNLFINYFLLLSVAKILNLKFIRKRLILSSFIGSLYSLIILLPPINEFFSLVIKLVMSVTIIILAFEWVNYRLFFKSIASFYVINFLFGGIIFFLWYFFMPNKIFINNGMIYLSLSPLFLIISTFISYLVIRLFNKIGAYKNKFISECEVLIKFNENSIILKAKIDTGNSLKEPFSGLPVVVVQYKFIKEFLPESIKEYLYAYNNGNVYEKNLNYLKNFRLIPYKTLSGTGILAAFKPTYIKILLKNQNVKKEAYVAICNEKIFNDEFHALINFDLIE